MCITLRPLERVYEGYWCSLHRWLNPTHWVRYCLSYFRGQPDSTDRVCGCFCCARRRRIEDISIGSAMLESGLSEEDEKTKLAAAHRARHAANSAILAALNNHDPRTSPPPGDPTRAELDAEEAINETTELVIAYENSPRFL